MKRPNCRTKEILTKWNANINSEMCALYSGGRNISDEARFHEDPITRAILEEISKEKNKNNLYNTKNIIMSVSQTLNKSEQEVRNTLNSLTSGKNPVIKEIIPIINLPKLDLQVYLVNLVFNENAGFTAEQIADVICNNPSVGWCAHYKILTTKDADYENESHNKIVFRISVFASSMPECADRINEIISPIYNAYQSKSIDYVPEKYVAYDRILSVEDELLDGRHIIYHTPKEKLKLTKQEETALVAMSTFRRTNGLCFETLLAKLQSDFSRDWRGKNISTRLCEVIDALREKQIINMFQVVTNDKKRGYNTYLVIYDLHPMRGESEQELISNFKQYIESISGVTHHNILKLGDWDVDVEIRVATQGEFTQIVSLIDRTFGVEIRKKQYMELIKEYKFTFLIPVVVDAIEMAGSK